MRHLHTRILCAALTLCMLTGMLPTHAEEYEIVDEEAAVTGFLGEESRIIGENEQEFEEDLVSEEGILSEEAALSEGTGYPWETMTDDEFAAFIEDGGYAEYGENPEAIESIYIRLDQVEDEELERNLEDILASWMEFLMNPDGAIMTMALSAGDGLVTLEEINSPDMFFRQEMRGTCTLASCAMLVRRAARMNGYPNWASITENALRPYAWIDGVGMTWNFSYAGITVAHGYFTPNLQTILDMLAAHPEGFVAYNSHVPHSVVITDYTDGVVYCGDPGYTGARGPIAESYLGTGNQDTTIAGLTAYWYVSSPKLTLGASVPPSEPDPAVHLEARANQDYSVTLNWNNVGAPGYFIFRSYSENGPWINAVAEVIGSNSWVDTGAEPLKRVYYCVQPFNNQHNGMSFSNVAGAEYDIGERIAEGTCGNSISWALSRDGQLVLAGSGAMQDYPSVESEPWFAYRNSITTVQISEGITSIGRSAFGGCTAMTNVFIPSTVTSIGDWAFRGCSSLPGVELPSGLQSIGYAAFRQCASLWAVDIPDSVTTIGDWAFSECAKLARVKLPARLSDIGIALFYEDNALTTVELPESLQNIGAHAFRGCRALKNLSFPASLRSVGQYAFAMCHSMTSLNLEGCSGVVRMDEGAFYNCTGLTEVRLNTTNMDIYVFSYCYQLRNIFLDQHYGNSRIGGYDFYGNGNMKWFQVLNGTISTHSLAFGGVNAVILVGSASLGSDQERPEGDSILRPYRAIGTVGNGLWYLDTQGTLNIHCTGAIPNYAGSRAPWFEQRDLITAIALDSGVTSIGSAAFADLYSLMTIQMPAKAVSIGENAFAGVTADVIYHDVDGSWSQVSNQNYGGSLTWAEQHRNQWSLTVEPSLTAEGTLTAQCSSCGRTQQVTLPALNIVDYAFREENGFGIYTWLNTEYGTYSFQTDLLRIVTQPQNVNARAGEQVSFTIAASGSGLRYQWQQKATEDTQWSDCAAQDALFQLTVQEQMDGWQFRCQVADAAGNTVLSEAATLRILPDAVTITQQPTSICAFAGDDVSFCLTASGEGLRYQWQTRVNEDESWIDCSSQTTGFDQAELVLRADASSNGQYRCIVWDSWEEAEFSDVVSLRVIGGLSILVQPSSQSVASGSTADFRLTAVGTDLHYQWQVRTPSASGWRGVSSQIEGYNTASLKPVAEAGMDGCKYRCVISDSNGACVISNIVTLNVN